LAIVILSHHLSETYICRKEHISQKSDGVLASMGSVPECVPTQDKPYLSGEEPEEESELPSWLDQGKKGHLSLFALQ
jgi:hypothetical protein